MSQAQVENSDGWRLQSLNIQHYSWEKDSPYKGKITFHNKAEESLSFNIPQDKMNSLLVLISESVVDSATRLGHRMAVSVQQMVQPALAAPETVIEPESPTAEPDEEIRAF